MATSALAIACAFRIRVSMSDMGSVILIISIPVLLSCCHYLSLPAGLYQPRYIALHGSFTQFIPCEAKLAVIATGASTDTATVVQPGRTGITWQGLKLPTRYFLLFIAQCRIA
jgi:hypothetical protein